MPNVAFRGKNLGSIFFKKIFFNPFTGLFCYVLLCFCYSRVFNTWSACPDFLLDFWPDFWPGFWPGFLTRFFGPENTVYSTTGTEKYSFTVLPGPRKPREKPCNKKSHIIKNPIHKKPSCMLLAPWFHLLIVKSCTVSHLARFRLTRLSQTRIHW